jgi:DNA replication initiation complex subunit (GINS family)
MIYLNIAPNALSDLKAKFKSLLKGGKSKKTEEKPAETKPAEPTPAAAPVPTATETAPTPAPEPVAAGMYFSVKASF